MTLILTYKLQPHSRKFWLWSLDLGVFEFASSPHVWDGSPSTLGFSHCPDTCISQSSEALNWWWLWMWVWMVNSVALWRAGSLSRTSTPAPWSRRENLHRKAGNQKMETSSFAYDIMSVCSSVSKCSILSKWVGTHQRGSNVVCASEIIIAEWRRTF